MGNVNWDGTPESAMRIFLENMVGEALLARDLGMDFTPAQAVDAAMHQVMKIARENIPLAQVLNNSDLILHAEGPGAEHDLPWLSAMQWIAETAGRNLRALTRATFDLLGADGRRLSRETDLRLSGVAPGSLWVGIKLVVPESDLIPQDGMLGKRLLETAERLPELARFIGDEALRPGIEESAPDPAMRDAALFALMNFSPTGKRGIHSLEISSPRYGSASLSQRERVVLREVFYRPKMNKARDGAFVGEVREADLDKTRFHLKTADGTLRCILPAMRVDDARSMLGKRIRVTGRYEVDNEGRPRLLLVERIDKLPETASLDLGVD